MSKDKNVLKTVNTIGYRVNLTYGQVTSHLTDYPTESGPYKYCRNIYEADLSSLNILRQNACETEYKVGEKPKSQTREFLGHTQVVETKEILPTMQWIQNTFPEAFI